MDVLWPGRRIGAGRDRRYHPGRLAPREVETHRTRGLVGSVGHSAKSAQIRDCRVHDFAAAGGEALLDVELLHVIGSVNNSANDCTGASGRVLARTRNGTL